jgi:hypothetical protein
MSKEQLQRGLYRLIIVISSIVALVAAAYAGTITRTPAGAQNVANYTALTGLTFGGLVYGIGRLLLWAGKGFAQD